MTARIRRRHIIPGVWLPGWIVDPLRRCQHATRRNIYGDEVRLAGGNRSRCLDCGRLLPDLSRCACGKPAATTIDGIPSCGDDR
jgi:hypothetical protein